MSARLCAASVIVEASSVAVVPLDVSETTKSTGCSSSQRVNGFENRPSTRASAMTR